jgi:hypothetical protein
MDYLLPKVGICTRDYLLENCTVLLICERELHMHARFLYTHFTWIMIYRISSIQPQPL